MSTTFIQSPKGIRASNLEEWALRHQDVLADIQARVLDVRTAKTERVVKTIEALRKKKVQNTLQEVRHWLRVVIPDPEIDKINAYLGCSKCGKRVDVPAGQVYTCTTCSKKDCVSSPRITFNCDVTDGTGQLAITAFTEDSEKLFRQTAPDLFRLKNSDDQKSFQMIIKLLQTSTFLIQVGPKATLSRNKVLQWVLKKVEVEGDPEISGGVTKVTTLLTPNEATELEPTMPGASQGISKGGEVSDETSVFPSPTTSNKQMPISTTTCKKAATSNDGPEPVVVESSQHPTID
ncbi:hypothetical protein RND81_14G131400 [Saponaria officinalis]|uniref:Replication factor A C-terminal domain-containing protein n=1 Tax=Saponaria officinalis TaxID=3572 RepID=A0AAW1GXG2_SAPOF